MNLTSLLVFGVVCGCAFGAVYQEGKKAGGEHDGTSAEAEEHHPLPNEEDTLHEGLKHKGKGGQKRGAAPLACSDANVQKTITSIHNVLRRKVPTSSSFKVSWDKAAQAVAQKWAEKCEFRHPTSDSEKATFLKAGKWGCGQNIASGTGDMNWNDTITKMWYGEVKDFTYGQQPAKVVGHYTAIVWKNTHKVGCGYAKCSFGHFFVCDYCPAGNVYPNQYKPFDNGVACSKCPKDCEEGLCKTPCEFQNEYSNCDVGDGNFPALFPNGCKETTGMEDKCKATCACKGKFPY